MDFPKDDLHSNGPEGAVNWDGEAFKKMKNLKMLIITNCRFSKGTTHLPRSLRVLKWGGYPSSSLPPDFNPKKLAILELSDSCLKISDPIQASIICVTMRDYHCKVNKFSLISYSHPLASLIICFFFFFAEVC